MEKTFAAELHYSLSDQEIDELVSKILTGLENDGFVHIKQEIQEDNFQKVTAQLGTYRSRSELKIDPNKDGAQESRRRYWNKDDKRPSIYKHLALDFHTDNPIGNRIAWYCIRQDEQYGALLLIDSKKIFSHFSNKEKEILKSIRLRYIEVKDGKEYHPWEPLLSNDNGKDHIYFASWHFKDQYNDQQLKMIERFKDVVQQEKEKPMTAVRLLPGQSIYVDNRRMLHARGPISENSKRHIIRIAIQSD